MTYENDICPYYNRAMGRDVVSNIRRDQQKWGALGIFLGLLGAAFGIYLGASA